MTTSERERQLDRQCQGLFSNCTVQPYLHTDDRKRGGDKENPEMPHGGVKIGHLARESASEGVEKNQKQGKLVHTVCLLVGTFFCRAEIRNFTL